MDDNHPYAANLGQTMINMIAKEHSAETADAFVTTLIEPTYPGTDARSQQDAAWASLNRRLMAAVKSTLPTPPAAEPAPEAAPAAE